MISRLFSKIPWQKIKTRLLDPESDLLLWLILGLPTLILTVCILLFRFHPAPKALNSKITTVEMRKMAENLEPP